MAYATGAHSSLTGVRKFTLTRTGYGREHHDRPGRCTGHE